MRAAEQFIFCDIDGTLLHARNAGFMAFSRAFEIAYGMPIDLSGVSFAGTTDLRVLEDLLKEKGIDWVPGIEEAFFKCLPAELDRFMKENPPYVFAGVRDFLNRASKKWTFGLVSGNIRACAMIKLEHANLQHFFSSIGGFGDDDGCRDRMAALALQRAKNPNQAFLLGDTPSDIHAAKSTGMVSVAVCNGQYNRKNLEAEHPDILLDSFEEADELFIALGL